MINCIKIGSVVKSLSTHNNVILLVKSGRSQELEIKDKRIKKKGLDVRMSMKLSKNKKSK